MRVMLIAKESGQGEAEVRPDERAVTEMRNFSEELAKAGVLLAAERLHPSSKGVRVKLSAGKHKVIDGPFTESKELVAGFWLWQVRSMDEAIEWLKRAPFGDGMEIEIRQVFEYEDFRPAPVELEREQEGVGAQAATKR